MRRMELFGGEGDGFGKGCLVILAIVDNKVLQIVQGHILSMLGRLLHIVEVPLFTLCREAREFVVIVAIELKLS